MMKRSVVLLLVVALMGLCVALPATASEQVLRYNLAVEPQTLDPVLNGGLSGGFVVEHCFEGLLRDRNGELVPAMAQSWTLSEDGKTYTFKLRDATWSDGKPVRAQDFEYSWRRSLDPTVGSGYAFIFYYIKGGEAYYEGEGKAEDVAISCPDDRTLVVTLENPTPYFLNLVAFMVFMPVREDIVEAAPDNWARSAETYVCNGPYRMTTFRPDLIVLEKNAAYWDASNVRLPRIDAVCIPEQSTELTAFENGEIDILDNIPLQELPRVSKMEGYVAYPRIVSFFYTVNTERKPFDDVRVRKALALAIDRKAIVEKVRQSSEIPACGLVPEGLKDSTGADFSGRSGTFGLDPEGKARPEEARRLLAEAGYPEGKGFPKFTLLYNTADDHKALAEAVQEMWRKTLGIDVELANQEWQVYASTRREGNYDVGRGNWWGDYPDPMTFLEMFTTGAGTNWPRWSHADYDALIQQSRRLSGPARDEAMYKAHALFMEAMPILPLFYPVDDFVIPSYIQGLERTLMGTWYMGNVVIEGR
jgi:oligopeptide transport system substrate-binding protein